jgi:hypothetical protein
MCRGRGDGMDTHKRHQFTGRSGTSVLVNVGVAAIREGVVAVRSISTGNTQRKAADSALSIDRGIAGRRWPT